VQRHIIAVGAALMTGCSTISTYPLPQYSFSVDTVKALAKVVPRYVAVDYPFTSAPGIANDIPCGAGRLSTPFGEPVAQYVANAMQIELSIAERLNVDAPIRLGGHIDTFNYDQNASLWTMAMTIKSSNGEQFRVRHQHRYTTRLGCTQAARAGMEAVQNLIESTVNNPSFPSLIRVPGPRGGGLPDDKMKTGGQERTRVRVGNDKEIREWAGKFGVSDDELLKAVGDVGNDAATVEAHLKRKK
jgi:hypothetical protein